MFLKGNIFHFSWLFLGREGLWFVCDFNFMSGKPEGSTDSGSREGEDRTFGYKSEKKFVTVT